AQNGYYGLSFVQNPNLLGKLLQYHLTGAGPGYTAMDNAVRQYNATPGGWEPWEFGHLHPEVSRDYWALAGNYARAVILHHPIQYVANTIPLIFNPPVYWAVNFVLPNRRFAGLLSNMQWIGHYSYGLMIYAPVFALLWLALLLFRHSARHLATEAMGAIALLVCFDRAITVAASYADYQRLQAPSGELATVLTFGTFVIIVAVAADLLARAQARSDVAPPTMATATRPIGALIEESDSEALAAGELAPTLPRLKVPVLQDTVEWPQAPRSARPTQPER
ncbi:MAG TPA: hypothetical protein VID72_03495, partial [Ktedonobacterales bacterium]